ncbi:serine/threonine-protein kinase [Amycolatopsis sp. NPDC021455]|uniref:serine/threonine-protein kinase n=1 Tax=Amycolatopsis sp. NPDC021455 TaxID=3154901 RepID=UPI0033DEDB88
MDFGTIADRYKLSRRLGGGGMGDVWLADDSVLGRQVALKFVNERELMENPGAHDILRDEAKTGGSLIGFSQIVSVLDLFDADSPLHSGPVLVMEYVDGCNLAEWMARFRPSLPNDETRLFLDLYIAAEIVEAIDIAHGRGIQHRDIKPQNVLCSKVGQVKVADFGLARLVEAMTRTHTVWGRNTPLYAAPEQWRDEKPTKESDVYQASATLYHLFLWKACESCLQSAWTA